MIYQNPTQYSEEFKLELVKDVLSGKLSIREAHRKYSFKGKSQVQKWMNNYEKYGRCTLHLPLTVMPKKEKPQTQAELEARIKHLEQCLEDEKLRCMMYSRMIDIAETEYKIPIRKKPNTK